MVLKIKKLVPEAVIPKMATSGSAGMDLTAITMHINSEGKYVYGTGLSFEIPKGYVGLIFPRSSIAKMDMTLSNCVGVIDSDFRGHVTFVFNVLDYGNKLYNVGDRIGQLVILKTPSISIEETEDLSETERGVGGYGSTGR